MMTLDYVYGCDTCLVAEVVEIAGALGQRSPDPLTFLPKTWTYSEDGSILCPECGQRAGGSGGDGPRTDPAPNKEAVCSSDS